MKKLLQVTIVALFSCTAALADTIVCTVVDETDTGLPNIAINLEDQDGNTNNVISNGSGDCTIDTTALGLNGDIIFEIDIDNSAGVANRQVGKVAGGVDISGSGATTSDITTDAPFIQKVNPGGTVKFEITTYNGCQNADPDYVVSCFLGANPSTTFADDGNNANGAATASGEGVASIVKIQRSDLPGVGSNEYFATGAQTGAVVGGAYQTTTGTYFVGAFARMTADYGPGADGTLGTADDPGAIYIIDVAAAIPELNAALPVIDIPNAGPNPATPRGVNGSAFGPTDSCATATRGTTLDDWRSDSCFFDQPGKQALGDLQLNTEEDTLFVTNLYERSLYKVDVSNPASPGAPVKVGDFIANPDFPAPTCNNGEFRPFALEWYAGELYVGGTCTGENGGTNTDLSLHVFRLADPLNSLSAVEVATFSDISYQRDYSFNSPGEPLTTDSSWKPWVNEYHFDNQFKQRGASTQFWADISSPMLSDIEFDAEGNMILGVTDRYNFQIGLAGLETFVDSNGNKIATSTNTSGVASPLALSGSGGDILKACWVEMESGTQTLYGQKGASETTPTGEWVLEGASSDCPQSTDVNNAQPGISEFYHGETFFDAGTGIGHYESAQGFLSNIVQDDFVMTTALDPQQFDSGGIIGLNNIDGSKTTDYEVYNLGDLTFAEASSPFGGVFFSSFNKGITLGDLETSCILETIQVGDFVWFDSNGDGVQDAGEDALEAVTVRIYDVDGNLLSTTTTDANGHYYFDGLTPNVQFYLTFDLSTASNLPIDINFVELVAPDSGVDRRDSDAYEALVTEPAGLGVLPRITFFTLEGVNDHSLDTGFATCQTSLGGTMTIDANQDGLQTVGESGIANVQVALLDSTSNIIATTLTDAGGNYEFDSDDGLAPNADYMIVADRTSDYEDGGSLNGLLPTNFQAGNDASLDSDAILSSGLIKVNIAAEEVTCEDNFSFDIGLTACQPAISGTLTFDTDQDGLQSAGEPVVSNVQIALTDSEANVIATTTTDTDGNYEFDFNDGLLPDADYMIVANRTSDYQEGGNLNGLVPTEFEAGSNTAIDSNAILSDGLVKININADDVACEHDSDYDIGLVPEAPVEDVQELRFTMDGRGLALSVAAEDAILKSFRGGKNGFCDSLSKAARDSKIAKINSIYNDSVWTVTWGQLFRLTYDFSSNPVPAYCEINDVSDQLKTIRKAVKQIAKVGLKTVQSCDNKKHIKRAVRKIKLRRSAALKAINNYPKDFGSCQGY